MCSQFHYASSIQQYSSSILQKSPLCSVASLPVDAAHRKQIMGIQANVWTETMVTTERLEYMLYPRIYALAEAAWSNEQQKDYKRFGQRLLPYLLLLQQDSLHCYNPMQPLQTPEIKK